MMHSNKAGINQADRLKVWAAAKGGEAGDGIARGLVQKEGEQRAKAPHPALTLWGVSG